MADSEMYALILNLMARVEELERLAQQSGPPFPRRMQRYVLEPALEVRGTPIPPPRDELNRG